ncbi:UNVERIFIED_CONTAM: Transcriptional corepressor SEUSS [Sesamum radiatum]|uniref:Transcriptional corepressor SEUSS n=1 Tax=Sesamum radiatum TaxID=300843 RepID=A0AAW2RDM7_SESRA
MDSSGLPIPIGGSAPLSAVLLELSSRGSKQGNGRSPLQTRDASLASPGPDNTTGQQEQLVLGRGQTGRFSAPNVRQLRNQSTNSKQQESSACREPGPLGAMPQHSGQPGTSPQGKHQNQRVLPVYPVSPMAAQAHLNLLRKMENAEPNPGKQPLVEEQQLHGKQPLVERQAEGEALPENPGVSSAYKPGKAAERLNQYMFQQRNRPRDNNIEFWRNLVAEFFAPSATKRYKNIKQIDSLFKAAWNCNMCNAEPCCGFEISQELLPRLHKVKYDTGVSEEHLHIESPTEHEGACGQIFLHYPKAAEESVHDQVRIVHYGQLRVIFSPDLKICSWEFCTQNHEEYIPRSSLIPQVHELGAAVQNYQLSARDSSSVSPEELQKRTDTFVSAAHQMVEALGMPFISQIGIVKRYVRCLQVFLVIGFMEFLYIRSTSRVWLHIQQFRGLGLSISCFQ